MKRIAFLAALLVCGLASSSSAVTITTVPVGNIGNAGDAGMAGTVRWDTIIGLQRRK